MGGTLLVDTLKLIEGGKVTAVPQDDALATYAGLISKKDGKIDADELEEGVKIVIDGSEKIKGQVEDKDEKKEGK